MTETSPIQCNNNHQPREGLMGWCIHLSGCINKITILYIFSLNNACPGETTTITRYKFKLLNALAVGEEAVDANHSCCWVHKTVRLKTDVLEIGAKEKALFDCVDTDKLQSYCGKESPPQKIRARMKKRSAIDRRSGNDRREAHDISYFSHGGIEGRSNTERRIASERRAGWVRVTPWSSLPTV